jgi:hypothetical protein
MSDHLTGPEWLGWEEVKQPQAITWKTVLSVPGFEDGFEECFIGGHMVAWLEKRPYYCDRGHYVVKFGLLGIDSADSFPRYYMSYRIAKIETEEWLKWRLWKIRE